MDSTALISDFHFATAANRGLLEAGKAKVIRLGVPELVLREVVHKWRQRVADLMEKAESLEAEAKRIGLASLAVALPSIDDTVAAFEKSLREKLEKASAAVYAIPTVSHETLVNKAIQRRSPFAEKGTGYRDALIWESVKEILRTSDEAVTFVTANKSDFGSSDLGIPQGLLDELTNDGIGNDRLTILATPADAAAATLEHAQSLLDQFEQKLVSDNAFRDQLVQELVEQADLALSHVERFRYSSDHKARFISADMMYEIGYFQPTRSWLISQGRIGIEFEAEADVDVEYDVDGGFPHHFDPQQDHWEDASLERYGSTTVTASLSGQLEFDASSDGVSAPSMSIWALSDPAPR
ncbi:PIN domain-containing protein [Arthrobacter gyeryongensis]|uniref:PIN domain-containing protein n=1 Tax=Arthrobacter gyeryongensis TaxID=1650592 RepID=UPI0031EAE969